MSNMELAKSQWTTDGDNYRINMPLQKIDKENRLVSGWASLDNPDLQGDIVLAEASSRAFSKFRGQVREMHCPIAVGRVINFKEDAYYDSVTKKFYNGIYVTAYVSKGAENTWIKVCDGTLQAFSIKGPIKDSYMEFSKTAGKPLRIIKDYDLEELSLVDAGGNQLANVDSIMKMERSSDDTLIVKGMIANMNSENVFYCTQHESAIAKTSSDETAECPDGHTMQNIGWFETDGSDKTAKVSGIIDSHLSPTKEQEVPANNQGGVNVAENESTETEVVDEVVADAEVESTEVTTEAEAEVVVGNDEVVAEEVVTETAADVSEVEAEPDFAKMFSDLQNTIEIGLMKNLADMAVSINKVSEEFEVKFAGMIAANEALTKNLSGMKIELEGVEKSLDAVESDTAVKKSGDLGGSTESTVTKNNGSKWGGRFLGLDSLQ